jgi:multidrug efflux pump subunit AcrB
VRTACIYNSCRGREAGATFNIVAASIRNGFGVAPIAALLIVLCGIAASRMGGEFIPSLDEGDVALQAIRIPGTSLTQSLEMQVIVERRLLKIPEVKEVFARTGTAEVATDLMPPSTSDGYIMLKPRKEWPNPEKSKAAVVSEIQEAAEKIPGNVYEISTDPATLQRTDIRRSQRRRRQDIRRRSRRAGSGCIAGAGRLAERSGSGGCKNRASRRIAGPHSQAQPPGSVASGAGSNSAASS